LSLHLPTFLYAAPKHPADWPNKLRDPKSVALMGITMEHIRQSRFGPWNEFAFCDSKFKQLVFACILMAAQESMQNTDDWSLDAGEEVFDPNEAVAC
jgi:hypothetical protein